MDLRRSRAERRLRLVENFEPRPGFAQSRFLRRIGERGAVEIGGCDVVLIENALECGGGNGAYAGRAIDFLFLDGGEDIFVVEQRDGGILIQAGDTEYEHERSLQAGRCVVHGKIAFDFRRGMQNAVFVARDFCAKQLIRRKHAGETELEIVA